MKLIPLGGAEEVGATCTLVEIGGHRLLVDAGIRLGQPDPLPDLARISDFGGIEVILVTHAHTDHTGALPVVHRAYPNIPLYATPGTQAIVSVLFNDALNIMKSRYELDREVPLYSKELVESLFTRMQPVQLGQTIKLFGGEVAATFFPAGHILGAACIGLQAANGESAFISGDISVTPQLTVGGMLPPVSVDRRFRPQVVMVESTYGNRLHANRAAEERRLVESIARIIEQGGRVLIPAFAVGRAQEVLLILARAMSRKVVAPFPVWVDGMVRSVCSVYTQHPYDLANALRRQIVKQGNPFFGSSAGVKEVDFTAITTPDERNKLAESKTPGCIVASSGMLSGGPSAFYARYIVRESDSAIFITGYQDEESPGRALLSLAEATKPAERVLKLDGEPVAVVCRVDKYSLSAHADAGEIAGLIEQLEPRETVLVHGAGGAREALSELLMQGKKERQVYLPCAGDELNFVGRKHRLKAVAISPKPETAITVQIALPDEAAKLAVLKAKVAERWGEKSVTGRSFTIQEIAQLWLEASAGEAALQDWAGLTAEEYTQLRDLLAQPQSGFVSDPRRPFLYRLARASSQLEKVKPPIADQFPLEQNAALAVVEKLLPPATGLYRKGAQTTEHKLLLYFQFPQVAVDKYKLELSEVAKQTGWTVELNQEVHQSALTEAIQKLLKAANLRAVKAPGLYRETREVKITVAYNQAEKSATDFTELNKVFSSETGWNLQLNLQGALPVTPMLTPTSFDSSNPAVPMEINAAYRAIEQGLNEAGVWLIRKGLKQGTAGPFIELSFVTPQLGKRYQAVLSELEAQIGWSLQINPEPHQQALQHLAAEVLREVYADQQYSVKGWGIHRDRGEVTAKVEGLTSTIDKTALSVRFHELTGWTFII